MPHQFTQHFTKPTHTRSPDARTLFTNARLLDPATGLDMRGELLVVGTQIAEHGANLFDGDIPEGTEVIDCKGHALCPGLIDLQVHFREPGQEHKETIETGSRSAAAGGITRVVVMPNTKPVLDDEAVLDFIHKRARETGYCHVHAYAAATHNMKGEALSELGLLKEAGAVGFTDDGLPVMHAGLMRQIFAYCAQLDVPFAQHAEDLQLSAGGCINEGKVSTRLGVRGIPNVSEAVMVERDILLAELTGAHYHVLHVSTREAVDAVRRGKARGVKVTAEAAPHHFTLTDEAVEEYRTFAKMNPPLRAEADRLALIEGLRDGTIDAIATDHAPHDQDSKRMPLQQAAFGIVGLETMLPLSLALHTKEGIPLLDVLAKMTCNAADIIHVKAGRLQAGYIADLCLIDIEQQWIINPDDFSSKSKNSPFVNTPTQGRAIRTVLAGETVYELRY